MNDKKFKKKLEENLPEILKKLVGRGAINLHLPKNLVEDEKVYCNIKPK